LQDGYRTAVFGNQDCKNDKDTMAAPITYYGIVNKPPTHEAFTPVFL